MEEDNPLDQFTMLSVIGKGTYGKVLLVKKKSNGCLYALKSMKKKYIQKRKHQHRVLIEKEILRQLDNPFLVKLSSSFQNQKKLFLVLQYCPGGQLYSLLRKKKKFTQQQTRFCAAQIILALEYLHSKDIVYRDLKPENVLLDTQGYLKLTDFGISRYMDDQELFSICGTPEYFAPEIIQKEGYGKAVDWWCLGSIIYQMVNGLPPFFSKNKNQLFELIKNSEPTYIKNWSKNLKNLLQTLLCKNPDQRIENIKNIKEHPWFASINWERLIKKQLKSSFTPTLKNKNDVSNFNNEFTKCQVNSDCSSFDTGRYFQGFSYSSSQREKEQVKDDVEQCENPQFTCQIEQN